MSRILIIGGTGFIGRHVALEAARRNWVTLIISKQKTKRPIKNKLIKYKTIDIENLDACKYLRDKQFDYIVNASGYVDHSNFTTNGLKIINQHFIGVINVIKSINRGKIKKFVQLGSSEEYGNSKNFLETAKEFPKTPYSFSKFALTNFLQMMYKSEKFPSVTLRIFLTYGMEQKTNRLIPYVIDKCNKNKEFKILSSNYIRDFCHIDDVINAIFMCLLSNKSSGKIYNIGSGKGIKIKTIVSMIHKKIKSGKPIFYNVKNSKIQSRRLVADIRNIKKEINWSPKISYLSGIKKLIKDST